MHCFSNRSYNIQIVKLVNKNFLGFLGNKSKLTCVLQRKTSTSVFLVFKILTSLGYYECMSNQFSNKLRVANRFFRYFSGFENFFEVFKSTKFLAYF